MPKFLVLIIVVSFGFLTHAQEAVKASSNPESLFTSPDPKLNANKQVVYKIVKDLLEAHNWDQAGKYLSEEYIQHNPNAKSGRESVVKYFTEVRKMKPAPIPEKLQKTKVVSVLAEGDMVVVAFVREMKGYTTTWFDMWKIKDGKAIEHWDPATRE